MDGEVGGFDTHEHHGDLQLDVLPSVSSIHVNVLDDVAVGGGSQLLVAVDHQPHGRIQELK